jgi:hypothetical protein
MSLVNGRRTLGYLGWLLDLDRFGSRGGGVCSGWSCLGPRTGDGWAEAVKRNFVWMGCKVQILHPQP